MKQSDSDERLYANGGERLNADNDDAPAWLRERQHRRARPMRRFAQVVGLLAVFAFGLYLLAEYSDHGHRLMAKAQALLKPAAQAIALDAPIPRPATAPYPIAQPGESIQPDSSISAATATAQPLADCIKAGNLIDEHVVACRYGTLPRDHRPAANEGMVSANYLAQYQAEQADRSRTTARRSASPEVERTSIKSWDGGTSYLAEWHSLDNRIESSSVCANHRRGSIDYRGCRKAAKVHFREQCRAWDKRWEQDRLASSKQKEERYCSATNGFSPMV